MKKNFLNSPLLPMHKIAFPNSISTARFYSDSHSSDVAVYIENHLISETIEFNNFFSDVTTIRESSPEWPYSEMEWEDNITHVNDDLYNYFHKQFLWDYHLTVDGLEPCIDFIYLVFYKTDPAFKLELSENKEGGYDRRFRSDINVWYYEKISISDLNELRNLFINAYKNNMFDDLHNSIQGFVNNVVGHLGELYSDEPRYADLYMNIIVPCDNKATSLPMVNIENILHNDSKF